MTGSQIYAWLVNMSKNMCTSKLCIYLLYHIQSALDDSRNFMQDHLVIWNLAKIVSVNMRE